MVPWDELKLIDVGLESFNNVEFVIVASSSLGKALIVLEIDNMGGQLDPVHARSRGGQERRPLQGGPAGVRPHAAAAHQSERGVFGRNRSKSQCRQASALVSGT